MDFPGFEEAHETDNAEGSPLSLPQSIEENRGGFELRDENSDLCSKPTFKNARKAKRRLEAFAKQKQGFLSPNKSKPINASEKSSSEGSKSQECSISGNKPRKDNPMDRAKATVEEIELLKLLEIPASLSISNDIKPPKRSRSKSSEREFIFRKREKKVRNYRRSDTSRRSPSPAIANVKDKHSDKSKSKYPRNWEEFNKDKWTFEKLGKDSHSKSKSSKPPNDIFRQLLFETPSDSIKPVHYKNERGDDITVPYKFMRYTTATPKIPYNANIFKVKDPCLSRKHVLERTRKEFKTVLDKFFSKCGKRCKTSEPMGQRNWYMKNWKDSDSKVLETSIGLSFLQTYSDDEEDEEVLIDPIKTEHKVEQKKYSEEEQTKDESKLKFPSDSKKEKIESENTITEENISWTPERKPTQIAEDMWLETPERKKDKTDKEEKSKVKESKKKTTQENDWETHDGKSQEPDKEKKKKKNKSKYLSDSDSSSDRKKSRKKKKNKLSKKERLKEKDKKTRKKEKLKVEKLKKEKRRQKEKEKEIMKKLKKELQQNLEQEEANVSNKDQKEISVKVKIEKVEEHGKIAKPVEDLKEFLELKENNGDESKIQVEDKILLKKEDQIEVMSVKVKKEKLLEEKIEPSEQKEVKDVKKIKDKSSSKKNAKKEEVKKREETPDTEEYQSNWESDEGISPIAKPTKKPSRGWESDEEIFERAFLKKKPTDTPYAAHSPLLEMPLDIKFPRRRFSRQEKRSRTRSPEYLDMAKEIKLLEAERINLSKERMQLEMEKIRIHELEREKTMEEMEFRSLEAPSPVWQEKEWRSKDESVDSTVEQVSQDTTNRFSTSLPSEAEKVRIADPQAEETASSGKKPVVVSVHSSPEISSTKSPTRTGLESAYQEFMKAVSASGGGGGDQSYDIVISSTESEAPSRRVDPKRGKVMYSRSRRDRKKRESGADMSENLKALSTTDPKILQEILLPGEVPEPAIPVPEPVTPVLEVVTAVPEQITPVPAPVPSPAIVLAPSFTTGSPLNVCRVAAVEDGQGPEKPYVLLAPVVEPEDAQDQSNQRSLLENSSPKKPFSFSTLVIPSKRSLLVGRSKWKLDDDSDEDAPKTRKMEESIRWEQEVEEKPVADPSFDGGAKKEELVEKVELPEKKDHKVEEEKTKKIDNEKKGLIEEKKEDQSQKRKLSKSRSPLDSSRDKKRRTEEDRRRGSTGRRADEQRRRGDAQDAIRKDRGRRPVSPRRRAPSPRKRRPSSPIHRRSSPRHRSPGRRTEARRSEKASRRTSPPTAKRRRSYSPTRPSPVTRRRSPSPRDASSRGRSSKSPRRSPLEGLKRSVADSTISDDLLTQSYAVDSSSSPLGSSTPAPSGRRQRIALSPKRPSLDERINQVLGIENQPQQSWKPTTEPQVDPRQHAPTYSFYQQHQDLSSTMHQQHQQSSKVLQVGNNLQVVPTEDLCAPPPPQPVQAPQKILQVGNMLQIVPSEMEIPLPPPEPVKERARSPPETKAAEQHSAEDVLADRMAENTRKRKELEDRKRLKEKKKKNKDRKRKMRLKVSTEEMIKRALELDGYIDTENEDLSLMVPEVIWDTPGLDASRSILSRSSSRFSEGFSKTEKERKSVQFADGVRPGDGTSPSGGEELASPPPQTDVLLKPKKYKKLGSAKRKKRKIKVKVVKKKKPALPSPPTGSDEEYENLPPPSPPPGSPPPTVFPPRAKVHTINNIPQHYLSSYGISTAPQTPPVVPNHPRINMPYQAPPTAMYRAPPAHNQHYQRMSHAPPMGMPHASSMHRDQQPYGSF